jgi:predicted GH43/DUF377 family glycosyl hydrolase
MPDFAHRFDANPLITPADVTPSRPDWTVECILNPGVFRLGNHTGLLLRVAERPPQEPGWVSTPIFDPDTPDGIRILRIREDDPRLNYPDPRLFTYEGVTYLTTLSHLRLAWSEDGVHFTTEPHPALVGQGLYETFGLEDCRVTQLNLDYLLTYTAVSQRGVAVAASRTRNFAHFDRLGIILPPHNKDCAIFDQFVDESYYCLHRPSGVAGLGGNFIWIARSPDLIHWGHHQCLATTRPGHWDSVRIGAGAAPILTDDGWLEIYHGADDHGIYRLGLLLLDTHNPYRVIARSQEPIMGPEADYEKKGFLGGVVFTNGHLVAGDTITLYYGAADTVICGATLSIRKLLATLK